MTMPSISPTSLRGAIACCIALMPAGMAFAEAVPLDTFGLSSMSAEAENTCLDANPGAEVRQTACDYNEAQYWRALVAADGSHFQLTTEATPGLCLEALPAADGVSGSGGSAAMQPCADLAQQKWLVTDGGAEYVYRLQNYAGGQAFCLDGNQAAPGAILDGAAYLESCADAPGQIWRIGGAVPVNGIPVPLEDLGD